MGYVTGASSLINGTHPYYPSVFFSSHSIRKSRSNIFTHLHSSTGYPWSSLPPSTTFCDIGSGVGALTLALSKANPHMRFTLHDLPQPMEDAKQVRAPLDHTYPLLFESYSFGAKIIRTLLQMNVFSLSLWISLRSCR
jgi:hypothetical protein